MHRICAPFCSQITFCAKSNDDYICHAQTQPTTQQLGCYLLNSFNALLESVHWQNASSHT